MKGFRRAKYCDIANIQKFISDEFKENHILSRNKSLFVFEYFDERNNIETDKEINMFLYEKDSCIQSILGFYDMNEEYCLSLWSAKKGTMYGLLLLKEVEKVLMDKPIHVVGLSQQAITLYEKLQYKVNFLNYQFTEFNSKTGNKQGRKISLENLSSLCDKLPELCSSFFFKRLFDNPFREYCFFYFENQNQLFVYRKIENSGNPFLIVVTILGGVDYHSIEEQMQCILKKEKMCYITIYSSEKFLALKNVYDSNHVFSIYESPYVAKNVKLYYARSKDSEKIIFKLFGDQERPATLSQKYIIINNYMYHYIRNEDEAQNVNNYISYREFEKHLDFLEKTSLNLTVKNLLSGNYQEKDEYYMLSFDDGYNEHGNFVLKTLNQRRIQGQFFIPVIPAKGLLEVNQIHQILNYFDNKVIIEKIKSKLSKENFKEKYELYSKAISLDDAETIFIKRFFQKDENSKKILQELFQKIPIERYKEYYVSKDQIDKLSKNHIIGNHTCNHRHLTELTEVEIKNDIERYEKIFNENILIKTVSYPFGSTTSNIQNIYENYGYILGWTVKPTFTIVCEQGRMNLNRFDAIELNKVILKNEGE